MKNFSTLDPRPFTLDPRLVTLDPRPSTKRQTPTDIPVDTSVDTRPIYRTILARDLVEYRPIAHLLINDAHGVGQRINHDTVGAISVNHRLYIGQLSVKSWSIIGRYMGQYIGRYRSYRCIPADARYMYRLILDCTGRISADVSTDVSTELKYR